MSAKPIFDIFTIGHSNIAAERLVGLLHDAGIDTVADVRSTPFSRRFPWFSARNLAPRLAQAGIDYAACGDALGGRPRAAELYCDGIADYEAMARQPEFRAGLDRLLAAARSKRLCLLCAEREPLDCHRCLLVARALAERAVSIGHILHDGTIEPHRSTEQRLLALTERNAASGDLFAPGQAARLAAAYRSRARAVAYRVKGRSPGGGPAEKE